MSGGYTTLILGSGISQDYGYPSNNDLIDSIRSYLETTPTSDKLAHFFLSDLKASPPKSIDTFLKDFPKYADVAKPTIARALYDREDHTTISHGFYKFLFHEIRGHFNKFKIISFNYDRSLEHYLSLHLRPYEGSIEKSFAKLRELEILHIHGRLSNLPGEDGPSNDKLWEYGYLKINHNQFSTTQGFRQKAMLSMQAHSEQLNTLFEPDDKVHARAREIITQSNRIFFLGFAYHDLNMKILGFDPARHRPIPELSGKQIYGTSYGIKTIALQDLVGRYPDIIYLCRKTLPFFENHLSLTDPTLRDLREKNLVLHYD
jgi:hypothetical protein